MKHEGEYGVTIRSYADGALVHSLDGEVHAIHGPIYRAWLSLPKLGLSGTCYPLSDVTVCDDGQGQFAHFIQKDRPIFGSIYFHPQFGAFYLQGPIRDKWYQLGGVHGPLGYPAGHETTSTNGKTRFNHFRRPGCDEPDLFDCGTIMTTPDGTYAVYGPIHQKWVEYGFEEGLGHPTTDVATCYDGIGKYTHFRKSGSDSSIFYSPKTGTHVVSGEIRREWARLDFEESSFGYPISDEQEGPSGSRLTYFENGIIEWSSEHGVSTTSSKLV